MKRLSQSPHQGRRWRQWQWYPPLWVGRRGNGRKVSSILSDGIVCFKMIEVNILYYQIIFLIKLNSCWQRQKKLTNCTYREALQFLKNVRIEK